MELKKVCEFFASLRRHYPDQVLRVLSQLFTPFGGLAPRETGGYFKC